MNEDRIQRLGPEEADEITCEPDRHHLVVAALDRQLLGQSVELMFRRNSFGLERSHFLL
jgi:hypothetical protein